MARRTNTSEIEWLTTGGLAQLTGIPQQTLISWDRSGFLRATARPGVRSSSRAPRRYDENALTAALFARNATLMGFKGDVLKRMIALIQRGERKALKAAALFTYRTGPGLMKHVFTPELASEDDQRWLEDLRGHEALVDGPTSLWTIREHFMPQAKSLIRMGEGALVARLIKESQ